MKNVIIILILSFSLGLNAQDLLKSDFRKTVWFVDNEERNLFESDTIYFTRILSSNSEIEKLDEIYIKLAQNGDKDITELDFKNSRKLTVEDLNVENWSVTKLVGKWKWRFDSEKQILKLNFKRKICLSFRIDSIRRDSIFWNNSNVELQVLNLIRISD